MSYKVIKLNIFCFLLMWIFKSFVIFSNSRNLICTDASSPLKGVCIDQVNHSAGYVEFPNIQIKQ